MKVSAGDSLAALPHFPSPRDAKVREHFIRIKKKPWVQSIQELFEIQLLLWADFSSPHRIEGVYRKMTFAFQAPQASRIQRQYIRGHPCLKHNDIQCGLIIQQNPTPPCCHSGQKKKIPQIYVHEQYIWTTLFFYHLCQELLKLLRGSTSLWL